MKKILVIFLILILFTSCSKGDEKKINVGFVSDGEKAVDGNRSFKLIQGINNLEFVSLEKIESENKNDYTTNVQKLLNNNDIIIANSFILNKEIKSLAEKNKNNKFIIFDSIVDPVQDNIKTIFFKTNESSFLAGYFAGLITKTNKLAYVGFEEGVVSDFYRYGFKSGVMEASKTLKKEIEVVERLIYKLDDYDLGKEIGNELYSQGVDVIYQTVEQTGLGIIESAKINGKYVMCYDVNQEKETEQNVILSTIKNYDGVVERLLTEYNSSKKFKGENLFLGIKEKSVGVRFGKINEILGNYISETIIDKAYNLTKDMEIKIEKGEIIVPFDSDTFSEYLNN